MYDNNQSFFARFSGFILFLVALGVVGFLVFLTVRSAQDNSSDGDLAVTTAEDTSNDPTEGDATEDEAPAEEEPADEGVVEAPDDSQDMTDTNDEPDREVPAAEEPTQAEDDHEEDHEEEAPAEEEEEDEPRQVASARNDRNNNDDLPNTGPADTALFVIVLATIGAAGYSYRQSRGELARKLVER